MKVTCVSKIRNSKGVIVNYRLMEDSGRVFEATPEQVKCELRVGKHQFTNLQLDSIGRLVDKASKKEKLQYSKIERKLLREYKKAYDRIMSGEEVLFSHAQYKDYYENSATKRLILQVIPERDKLDELFMSKVIPNFEKYMLSRGGRVPYKLHIVSKNGVYEEVTYSIRKIEVNFAETIKQSLKDSVYENPSNYSIKAYKIDKPNELMNVYTAPDMSLISMKKEEQQNQKVSLKK